MGKTVVKVFKGFNNYKDQESINDLVNYIYDHPENGAIEGINISNSSKEISVMQMKKLKEFYNRTTGRQVYHFVVSNESFSKLEPSEVMYIGLKSAALLENKYQILLTVHAPDNTSTSRHLHFLLNTVSIKGKKLHMSKNEFIAFIEAIKDVVNRLLNQYCNL